jgi:hypothetical protein
MRSAKMMVNILYKYLKNKALISKKFALGPKYASFEPLY